MKQFKGTIVSDKMDKTVSVLVETRWMHPIYQKSLKRTKKYLVHNEIGAKTGDVVLFNETKPISKNKKFTLVEIVK